MSNSVGLAHSFTDAQLREWASITNGPARNMIDHDLDLTICELSRALLAAREKNAALNRRCQSAESGLTVKLDEVKRQGGSFGRALAFAGYVKAEAENAELRSALAEAKAEIEVMRANLESLQADLNRCHSDRDKWHDEADQQARLCGEAISAGQRRESETEIRMHERIAKLEARIKLNADTFDTAARQIDPETQFSLHNLMEIAATANLVLLASPSEPAGSKSK